MDTPQIPACDGSKWPPALSIMYQVLRFRQLFHSINQREALTHRKITDGQHVGAPEPEDQQHLHCPAPDAAHLCQSLDDLFVLHPSEARKGRDRAIDSSCGKVLER